MTTYKDKIELGSDSSSRRFDDVRQLLPDIDNPSPIVRMNHLPVALRTQLYLKLEWLNPFGSVKDRTAAYLLAGLEERGELGGRELVEASSGNTAIALAALAGLSGTRLTTTIPDGVPEEKKTILRMLGAEVWETPDDLCPVDHPKDGAIALARSLAESEDGERFVAPRQYENADNVKAHYETTGPEIWNQTAGQVTVFAAGYGTTGTLTGAGRYLKEKNPEVRVVGIEPEPGHRLPGLKSFVEAKVPGLLDRDVIDQTVVVPDAGAYRMTKDIWRSEALMVGPSTGAVVHGLETLDLAEDDVVVAISADSGVKYTSYFEEILEGEGNPTI